ncbi:MAG: HEAT repeat domain-containing protein [bacterium]
MTNFGGEMFDRVGADRLLVSLVPALKGLSAPIELTDQQKSALLRVSDADLIRWAGYDENSDPSSLGIDWRDLWVVRTVAALAMRGRNDDAVLASLVSLASDPFKEVRLAVIASLAGRIDFMSVDTLLSLKKDLSWDVALAAVAGLCSSMKGMYREAQSALLSSEHIDVDWLDSNVCLGC